MLPPRAPAGPRQGFVRRNFNSSHAWQSAGHVTAPQSEDLSNITWEQASSEQAQQNYTEVKDFLQGCPFFVLDLVEGTSFYGATTSDLISIPVEFPKEVSAIIITCLFSRKASIEHFLLKLCATSRPIIILFVDEGIRFHTDEILDVHEWLLQVGASDMILQSISNNFQLDLLMRVQSAQRANQVRRAEVGKRLEQQQRSMFWPFVHRIMEGFPKLCDASDSQIASRKIMERMQQGSFGTVFKCVNDANGQEEVVKSIPKSSLTSVERLRGIWNEIVLLQKLEHPNVVACNAAKQTATKILIFMDYAGPHNLHTYLKIPKHTPPNEGCVTTATGISIIGQILAGLAHCHDRGVAHRDLKPENVVVMLSGGVMKVRIVDFGLATQSTNACSDFVGTVPFIAPEVATTGDHDQYDPSCADMWSCGVVFLEILCGVGKINQMLGWRHSPRSRSKYREDLENFFSIETQITASVEADVGLVGSVAFPNNAHTTLLGMLTLEPTYRWNATTAIEALTQDTGLSVTASCD